MSKKENRILIASVSSGSFGHVDVYAQKIEDLFVIKKISRKETKEEEFYSEVSILKIITRKVPKDSYFPRFQNSWEDKKYFYLQMSYISGMNLDDFCTRIENEEVVLTPKEYKELFIDMTQRIVEIHQIGILHFDIKPGNFIRDHRGKIYLVDFGFAMKKNDALLNKEELGTLHYKAPEVYIGGEKTEKTDIFSLGCTFFYFLFKKHFFQISKDERRKISKIRIDHSNSEKNEKGEAERENLRETFIQEKITQGDFISPKSGIQSLNKLLISMVSIEPAKRPTAKMVLEKLQNINWKNLFSKEKEEEEKEKE